ncbi:hypothetical protein CKY47_18585 [Saccharothrix yanglingensis]|uniref:Uncharacterized protein n=1 Tax=Saccharothrix yanglingensis TaxID=659496 RepID=A0ABU0X3U4_9PSEU|nr:hypothetical protein [Saccharothrix yanglingensis]
MGRTDKGDVWIRLRAGWRRPGGDRAVGWALWQPGYTAHPWPRDELRPSFTYYVCDDLPGGGRGIVSRATATGVLRPTEVDSAGSAYRLVAETLFDDDLAMAPEEWYAERYNRGKSARPWPQSVTAWRAVVTERVGPYVLPGLTAFPRTGWLRSAGIAL